MASTKVRVAVAGARGKTGSVIAAALAHSPDIEIVGTLVRPGSSLEDGEFTELAELAAACKPDVLVDFTIFPASKELALQAISLGVRPVIGTSGYTTADIHQLREACKRTGVGAVYVANFAMGAMLMMQFAMRAAPYFSHADIVETHHAGKKDAPSGTALAIAQSIARSATMHPARAQHVRAECALGADVEGVGVHSIRSPNALATHEIQFANEDETLTIRHSTATRTAFVAGVVKAVRAAPHLDRLVEGLEDFS